MNNQSAKTPYYTVAQAAKLSGLSPKMIRYYEEKGIISTVIRSNSNYRLYSQETIRALIFIYRTKALGFPLAHIHMLLDLVNNRSRKSASVKQIVLTHLASLDQKIEEIQAIKAVLTPLVACCKGDSNADCPIIDELVKNT